MANPHTALPVQTGVQDTLRQGLPCLKSDASFAHPVEALLSGADNAKHTVKTSLLGNLYGLAVPAKMSIEAQILSKPGRLPGLPSSRLGLDSLTGALDDFGFENYLGDPFTPESVPVDIHSRAEEKFGIATKSQTRGFV